MVWWLTLPNAVVLLLVAGVLCWWMSSSSRRFTHIPSLRGKHVVITGGSSGIGLCIAMQCAAEGAYVTIMSRSSRKLEEAHCHIASSLKLPDAAIRLQPVDVGDASAVALAIHESFNWRPIDVLVCSAGIAELSFLEDMKPSRMEEIARTNIFGVVFPIQSAIPLMRARSKDHPSSIVIVGSLSSCVFMYASNIYNATKAAVKGLAELLRLELLPFGIGVTLSIPGFTQTPLYEHVFEDKAGIKAIVDKLCAEAPVESPDDVARLTIEGFKRNEFLVSTTFTGFLARVMGRGFLPSDSFTTFLAELLLMIPIRILSLLWLMKVRHILLSNPVPTRKKT